MKPRALWAFIVLGACTADRTETSGLPVDGAGGDEVAPDADPGEGAGSEPAPVELHIVPPQVMAFVGDREPLRAYLDNDPIGAQATWRSSDPGTVTVDAEGVLQAVSVGTATITVSVQGNSTSASVRVTPEPTRLEDLLAHFSFAHEKGPARVYSDISPAFSRQHGDHLAGVYNYFAKLFARSYGNASVAYYTHDQRLYERLFAYCPSVVIAGGRAVTGCYDSGTGIQSLMIIPFQTPDFGTQLHEFSHQFLYATWPESEDHPWFKEGTGMFWESGELDGSGELVVRAPLPYLRDGLRRFQSSLLPLDRLVTMSKPDFYGHAEPVRVYSQSGMFVFYLMQRHPEVMRRVFDALNAGSVRSNAQLLALIEAATGLTLAALDRAYVAHALTL